MESQTLNTSLQHLQNVEKRIVRVLELAGGVMDELSNPAGPRKEFMNSGCREFMQLIKDIQVTLRDEIKSACEYRPFEKCDYSSRISNELCCKKLEYVISQLGGIKETIDEYNQAQVQGKSWTIRLHPGTCVRLKTAKLSTQLISSAVSSTFPFRVTKVVEMR